MKAVLTIQCRQFDKEHDFEKYFLMMGYFLISGGIKTKNRDMKKILVGMMFGVLLLTSCGKKEHIESVKLEEKTDELRGEWSIKDVAGTDSTSFDAIGALLLAMSQDDLNVYEFNMKNFIIKSAFDDSVYSVSSYVLSDDGAHLRILDEDTTESFKLDWLGEDEMMLGNDEFKITFERN